MCHYYVESLPYRHNKVGHCVTIMWHLVHINILAGLFVTIIWQLCKKSMVKIDLYFRFIFTCSADICCKCCHILYVGLLMILKFVRNRNKNEVICWLYNQV